MASSYIICFCCFCNKRLKAKTRFIFSTQIEFQLRIFQIHKQLSNDVSVLNMTSLLNTIDSFFESTIFLKTMFKKLPNQPFF